MGRDADRILLEALKLAPEERAWIVVELLASIDPEFPSPGSSDADWIREIERRARAALAGSPAPSWSEARTKIAVSLHGGRFRAAVF